MQQQLKKVMLIISSFTIGIAVIWFLLGTTANFQRGIDLITTIKFVVIWFPAIILLVIPLILIRSQRRFEYTILIWPLIISHFFLAVQLYKAVDIEGWLTEAISREPVKTTSDGMYDYRLELINSYQKNSFARLYIHDNVKGHDIYIPVKLKVDEVQIKWLGEGEKWSWSLLSRLKDENQFELHISRVSSLPSLIFHVDIKNKTSVLLTN